MQKNVLENLVKVRVGLLLAIITLVYGFGLGGSFGAFEENIREYLSAKAKQVFETKYNGDEANMNRTVGRSWGYFKRAHLHANGLGAVASALILLLVFLPVGILIKKITAICLGLGSLGYSTFWMFVGLKAPALGSTGLAKESLSWLAVPSAGLCIIGVVAMLVHLVVTLFFMEKSTRQTNS